MGTLDELCFQVEQWADDDSRIECVLSASCNALIGLGAYHEAVKLRGHKRLTLRHGARVIESHTPEAFKLRDAQLRAELEAQIEQRRQQLALKATRGT